MAQQNPFADLIGGQQRAPVGTILPELPPPPPQAPGRTPGGAATEGLGPGEMWIDPTNPRLGKMRIPTAEGAPPSTSLTTAQAEVDKKFAAEYVDWRAAGGYAGLERNLAQLDQAIEILKSSDNISGPIYGRLPKFIQQMVDPRGPNVKDQVERVVSQSLRQILGGQFAMLEGQQVLQREFDPTQQEEVNIERIESQRDQLRELAIAKESSAKYYEQYGTLSGWTGPTADERKQITQLAKQEEPTIPGSALDVIRTSDTGGGAVEAVPLAPVGTEQFRTIRNPVMSRAHDDLVQRLLAQGGGRLDPQAYAAGRMELAREFGVALPDPGADMQGAIGWANAVNQYLDAGGRTIPTDLTQRQIMSASETAANNLVNNPLGAALIGAANTGSFGTVEALAPGQYMALGDAQPGSQLVGEIGGAIGGTGAIGALGRGVASRVAPQLLQGGGRGQFARNVGADATFGGIFGGVTEGDPLTGAALGAVGSIGGQGLARGIGAGVGGLQRTQAAQALRDRGVPISVARQIGMGRVEDLAQSVPIVGDVSRARQLESFEGFNRAALEEAGAPIGFVPTEAGRAGAEEMGLAVGQAYNQAVQGVTAPLDRQFLRDMVPVRRMAQNMNQTNRAQLAETLRDAVQIPADAGAITPQQFQDAISNLKALRSNAKTAMPNSANTLRKAATQTIDALEGAMTRAGGQNVVEGLQRANMANRGLNVIENAGLDRAAVGTQAGAPNIFTPAQLLQSLRASERRGYGSLPGLRSLGEQGQEVLPSTVPNSGTADRMLGAQMLTGVGALGGMAGFASNPTAQGAAEGSGGAVGTVATIGGLAALLGTRGGQRVLEQILITRPQAAQQIGQGFRRRAGLFGSGGAVVGLNQQ